MPPNAPLGSSNVSPSLKDLEAANRQKVAKLSMNQLKSSVFYYASDYFRYIGEHLPEVQAIKNAVVAEDVVALKTAFHEFGKIVLRLEYEAGHRGRPLIMDYYFWHEHYIEELKKRLGLTRSSGALECD